MTDWSCSIYENALNNVIQILEWNKNLTVNNDKYLWLEERGLILGRENEVEKYRKITNHDFSDNIQTLTESINKRREYEE